MRVGYLSTLLLIGHLVLLGCATDETGRASERDAVLRTLDSWNEGWKTRDAGLAVSDYALDADWTNAFGDRFQSRAELEKGLQFIFSLDFVMTGDSRGNEYQDVTFLSDHIALIRSRLVRTGQMTDSGRVMRDREINHLRVLEKKDEHWQIVSHLISQAKEKGSL